MAGLADDYYIYDEVRSQPRGRRTGPKRTGWAKVRVRLAAANTEKRQLDFALEAPLKKR